MSNSLKKKFPFILQSKFTGPLAYNFAGDLDGGGDGSSGEEDPDAPDPNTPAGAKWKKMREENKAANLKAQDEREARIRAEAAAEATEALLLKIQGKSAEVQEVEDDDDDVVPEGTNKDDAAYVTKLVEAALRKQGFNGKEINETLKSIAGNQEQMQIDKTMDAAKASLVSEFEDSVPFNYAEALKYAQENNLGLVGTTALQALRIAHKEMNEEKFDKWKAEGSKPRKSAPSLDASGGGNKSGAAKEDEEIAPKSLDEATKLAKAMLGEAL
jgi:hypothetical protein